MFHASTRRFWVPEFADSDLNLAGWTRNITDAPTITVGNIGLVTSQFCGDGPESAGAEPGEGPPCGGVQQQYQRYD
mgnify:CR=1 FL=1